MKLHLNSYSSPSITDLNTQQRMYNTPFHKLPHPYQLPVHDLIHLNRFTVMAKHGEKRPAPALLVSDEDFDVESEVRGSDDEPKVRGSDDEPQVVSFEDQPDFIPFDDSEWQGPDDGSEPEGKRAPDSGARVSGERTLDWGTPLHEGQRESGDYPHYG